MSSPSPLYSFAEEAANTLTHGLGLLLSVAGLTLLMVFSFIQQDAMRMWVFGIYGGTLTLLFLASTLYHGVSHVRLKAGLQRFDHCAIYLFIAGSYTPFLLISLEGSAWSLPLLVVIWSLAGLGIVSRLLGSRTVKGLSLATYLGMGWLVVIAGAEIIERLPTGGLALLVMGGIVYSVGVIFYSQERIPFNHAIWHVFVLGGSLCHFLSIYWYVLPAKPLPV